VKVLCKNSYYGFTKGNYYEVKYISTIFEKDDFITIESDDALEHSWYRFRLNKSDECIADYIGKNELYFHDYFINVKEERKQKLVNLSDIGVSRKIKKIEEKNA